MPAAAAQPAPAQATAPPLPRIGEKNPLPFLQTVTDPHTPQKITEVELLRLQIIEAETEAARRALLEADAKAKASREASQAKSQAQAEAAASPVSSKTFEDSLEALVEEGAAVEPKDPEPATSADIDNGQLAFNKFLMLTSVANEHDIKKALGLAVRTPLIVATALSMIGIVDDRTIEAIVRIYEAVRANSLSLDEGVFAISYILNKITNEQISVEEAFQKLSEEAAISI
jgi:hypothetical protein